ncbi:MAG: hypothetical protein ABIA75_01455 [Candidatus Neomarinimicrobiota bacterium]
MGNTTLYLILGIVTANLVIYWILPVRAFRNYLIILLAGSVAQHWGCVLIWEHSHLWGQAYYDLMMIVIEFALVCYVLQSFLGVGIPRDWKFYSRFVTIASGVIIRAVTLKISEITTEDIYLAFRVVVLIFCVIYLLERRRRSLTDLVPLTLCAHCVLYLFSYVLADRGLTLIHLSNNFLLIAMYLVWLTAGAWQLIRREHV